jgi:glutathione S-transferase
MSEPAITLYRLGSCPFCERVVEKLQGYGLEYHPRFVEPLHSERDVLKRVAGVRTVPVIVDEHTGVTMAESGAIVRYPEETYGSAGTNSHDGATVSLQEEA